MNDNKKEPQGSGKPKAQFTEFEIVQIKLQIISVIISLLSLIVGIISLLR